MLSIANAIHRIQASPTCRVTVATAGPHGHCHLSSRVRRRVYCSSTARDIPDAGESVEQIKDPTPDAYAEMIAMYQAALAGDRRSFSSKYYPKKETPVFVQLDHAARRREKETKEIIEAGRRKGVSESVIRENIALIEGLLPDLQPNLDKMKASDWVSVLTDVNKVATVLVTLKTTFPRANVSKIIAFSPKMLLKPADSIAKDCALVKQMLAVAEAASEAEGGIAAGSNGCDEIIEAVPYLINPSQLSSSLVFLQRFFPGQDPLELLRTNPNLLLNIGEADAEADPQYGDDVGQLH